MVVKFSIYLNRRVFVMKKFEPGTPFPTKLFELPGKFLTSLQIHTLRKVLYRTSEESLDVMLSVERDTMTLISLRICTG